MTYYMLSIWQGDMFEKTMSCTSTIQHTDKPEHCPTHQTIKRLLNTPFRDEGVNKFTGVHSCTFHTYLDT